MTVTNSYTKQEILLNESLKNKALAIFNLITDMRHWNAQFEGVYVKSTTLQKNPYLTPGSIKSEKGEELIWVNPAFMTRQIVNIASKREGLTLKLTSNKLINYNNAPDEKEKEILNYFDDNPDIPYYWKIEDNSFRFMGALKTKPSCLKCHSQQGYKEGDIRGGLSLVFDAKKEFDELKAIRLNKEQSILFLIIAAIGTFITIIIYQTRKRNDDKKISNLNKTLELKIQELDEFNQTLHKKVQTEIIKQREKENLLIQQSKLAALGEMIGNIAHQWRQPISAVSAVMMNIKWTAISHGIDKNFLDERIKEANDQLKYMSQTIDDFGDFFKPNKEKEYFNIKQTSRKAYKILQMTLEANNINLQIHSKYDINTFGYSNEFSQVILNIISNAKDVLIEREITQPKIDIHISSDISYIYCKIEDNAGGIDDKYIYKVFEPYFTTKEHNGTGIGLYISKEIIHKHMKGTLTVHNTTKGASFMITIPNLQIIDDK